jgi:hypothetical protein
MNSDLRSYETSEISFQTKYNENFRQRPSPAMISTDNPSTKSFVCLWHMTDASNHDSTAGASCGLEHLTHMLFAEQALECLVITF